MKKTILILTAFGLSFLTNAQQRSCHTMSNLDRLLQSNPRGQQQMQKIEDHTHKFEQQFNNKAVSGVVNIPVVVHVVYNTSSQNISDAQIASQIQVLNEDFRRMNSDKTNTPSTFSSVASDIEIEFCLASVDPNGNSTNGITRTSTSYSSFSTNDGVKSSSTGGKNAWPTSDYLNIWVCNMSGSTLGYAQFPGSGSASTDGVVISYKYFGRNGSAQAPFNKGRTATHEVGHWLNLRHIWGDGGCSYDDYVSDTPLAGNEHYGCPSWPQSTCSSNDMYMNYMDYVDDACMNLFTAGQKSRMRALFSSGGYRESILNSNGCGGNSSSGYCATIGQDASYEWVANVNVGTINNSTGSNGGYGDFTSISTDLQQGQSYPVSLTPGFQSSAYDEYWKVWIDYNQDMDFDDAGELVYDAGSMSQTTVSGNINIPTSSSLGQTRMRVSMKYNGSQTACETFQYGEVEDYSVNITPEPQPCDVPTNLTSSAITETSASISWNAAAGAQSYTIQRRVSGSTSWSSFSSSSTSGGWSNLTASTTYEWRVRTNCSSQNSNYSSITSFTTLDPTPTGSSYCASAGGNSSYEWIANVTVGNINNSTGNNGGYENFTAISTDLEKGTNYNISLSPGFQSSAYNEYWKIWIDINQDGDFTDANELVFDAGSMSQSTVNGTLSVPSTAMTGATRMRVSMKYNGAQTSCESFQYGEVEDYTVNIISQAAPVTYCGSEGGNSSYEWIANVTVGSINNTTGNNGGYEDFTSISTNLVGGNTYNVSLTPGFQSSTYNEYWKIWIDLNKDGDFTDANELVFDAGSMSQSTVTGTMTIPNGYSTTTRMRVSMKYNGAQSSCESFQYGEVEDYTVNISSGGSKVSIEGIEHTISDVIKIFPNPTVSRLNIELTKSFESNSTIELIDMKGVKVFSDMIEEDTYSKSIELDGVPAGVYHLFIISNDKIHREKVTILN